MSNKTEQHIAPKSAPKEAIFGTPFASHSIEILIPSENLGQEDLERQKMYVNAISLVFTNKFGGATVQNVTGWWNSSHRNCLVTEKIVSVKSFVKDELFTAQTFHEVKGFVDSVKDGMSQDAISVIIDGKIHFV